MLTNIKDILTTARKKGVAIGAFNAANYETAVAIVKAAELEESPVILQIFSRMFANGKAEAMGGLVRRLAEKCPQPVAVHLDHGENLEQVKNALLWGYTSVMLDGSRLPLAENIAVTAEAARLAHAQGATCEGEIGHVAMLDETALTEPAEAKRFADATQVDALAVSIGTAHGYYKAVPKLDIGRCREIGEALPNLPLVLHGGTGTPMEEIQKVIPLGIAKINVATEFQHCFLKAVQAELKKLDGKFVPIDKFMDAPMEACVVHLRRLIRAFALKE
ncbi:MAG: class II fructose-bisphosphate aldolase [Victivallales bacterium]|nr:class II fructose-bisphosphate aldolase [Victivallales bacterium]